MTYARRTRLRLVGAVVLASLVTILAAIVGWLRSGDPWNTPVWFVGVLVLVALWLDPEVA